MLFGETGEIFNFLNQNSSGEFLPEYNRDARIKIIIDSNKDLLFNPQKINLEAMKRIQTAIVELKRNGYKTEGKFIGVEYNDLKQEYLTAEDCKNLKAFETMLKEQFGAELVVASAEDIYNIDDIINANAKLDAEIDYINSLTIPNENNRPLNDMEKFLMVYDFCTNFKYQENDENHSLARSLTSILNSQNIVCVGYAELMRVMCTRLGIECHCQSSTIYDKNLKLELGGHRNNIVVLDGKVYYADACWDNQKAATKGLKLYNHCLLPLEDRKNFNKVEVEYYGGSIGDLAENKEKAKKYLNILNSGAEISEKISQFISSHNNIFQNTQYDPFVITTSWADASSTKLEIEKLKLIIDYYNKYEVGEAIPYKQFEQALLNIYLAKGMNEKAAQSLLDRTMELNEDRAKQKFNSEATNCFRSERTNELEL